VTGWTQAIKPSVSPFRVAAARVEHCSLRKMLSMCVRTVLGLIANSCATCLLLAPRLISRRMRHSRLPQAALATGGSNDRFADIVIEQATASILFE